MFIYASSPHCSKRGQLTSFGCIIKACQICEIQTLARLMNQNLHFHQVIGVSIGTLGLRSAIWRDIMPTQKIIHFWSQNCWSIIVISFIPDRWVSKVRWRSHRIIARELFKFMWLWGSNRVEIWEFTLFLEIQPHIYSYKKST